jgi:hypothetical protein
MVVEYLYVDSARLGGYFEQLSSSSVKYEKVPSWSVELSLTGPKANGTQSRPGRPFSDHEKIQFLLQQIDIPSQPLRCLNTVLDKRLANNRGFDYRPLRARRVHIPSKPGADPEFKGLNLWIGIDLEFPNHLRVCLIENVEDQRRMTWQTGDWLLTAFLSETKRASANRLSVVLPEIDQQAVQLEFSRDPISMLRNMGADIGSERDIESLYRIRRVSCEGRGGFDWSIGYPIFIAELPTGFREFALA